MIDKLKKFCGDPKYNERIGTPWSIGEWTYATTGFVLVVVPRLAEVPERTNTVSLTKILETNPVPETGWVDAPGIADLNIPECPRCKGKESDPEDCEECDGNGIVYLENDFHDYECECKTCSGEGSVGGCRTCGGVGYLADDARVHIAGIEFKTIQILDLIRTFGPAQVAPPAKGNPAWVRFLRARALVMPITHANGA
jgi:hypothetical protein